MSTYDYNNKTQPGLRLRLWRGLRSIVNRRRLLVSEPIAEPTRHLSHRYISPQLVSSHANDHIKAQRERSSARNAGCCFCNHNNYNYNNPNAEHNPFCRRRQNQSLRMVPSLPKLYRTLRERGTTSALGAITRCAYQHSPSLSARHRRSSQLFRVDIVKQSAVTILTHPLHSPPRRHGHRHTNHHARTVRG